MYCPLCAEKDTHPYTFDALNRQLYRCPKCYGVFVHFTHYHSREVEKKRYLKHENSANNKGYLRFLFRALNPALQFLNQDMKGLDFGSGEKPVLAHILNKKGFRCDVYDLYFHPEIPKNKYDFIFSTETFEHFSSPDKELRVIYELLKTSGLLVTMTSTYNESTNFQTWHYAKDFTHLFFYHEKTFDYVASTFQYSIEYTDVHHGVWIFKKQ